MEGRGGHGRGHAQFGGQLLLKIERIAIWIQVHIGQGLAHRSQREARRTQRVFVGCQLDDVLDGQAEFASHFFDRPPGLIDGKVFQRRVN
jgi:hypothetical protein